MPRKAFHFGLFSRQIFFVHIKEVYRNKTKNIDFLLLLLSFFLLQALNKLLSQAILENTDLA